MLQIFDFNIHLPSIQHDDVNVVIHQDLNLDVNEIQTGFKMHQHLFKKCVGVNFLLFNTNLFLDDVNPFFESVKNVTRNAKYTALVDFRDNNVFAYIDKVKQYGVHAIMFSSYLQQISESDFLKVINVCKYAEEKKLIICIDGSYGTSKMYAFDNMKLACTIADIITIAPIVIIHSGGCRLIEAMLLAEDKKNVWLDTSFSLPYYLESSIEADFAYVLKKMSVERIVFGSDHPYLQYDEAISKHLTFFAKYNFSPFQIEKVMGLNALQLYDGR